MTFHERIIRRAFEPLCGVCAVVSTLAAADGSWWWAAGFSALALVCFEASWE